MMSSMLMVAKMLQNRYGGAIGKRYLSPSCPKGIMSLLPQQVSPWVSRRRRQTTSLAVYEVEGYKGSFEDLRKRSISPFLDLDLMAEEDSDQYGGR